MGIRPTLDDVKVRVLLICLIIQVQNGRVAKLKPQEIRRQHPVPIATRLVGAEIILVDHREPALADLICRVVVDDPGDDGLELIVRLIGTVKTVIPGRAGGEVVVRPRGCVVPEDTCPYVECSARVVEYSTAVKRRVEAVASRGRMCPDPVVSGLLVRLNNDHVALAHSDAQCGGLVRSDGHQIILDHGHRMVVNRENKVCARSAVDQPQDVLLIGRKCCLEVCPCACGRVMTLAIDYNRIRPCERKRIGIDLLSEADKG